MRHSTSRLQFPSSARVMSNLGYFKVTLARSTIGLPKEYKDAAAALKLFKTHKTSVVPVTPQNVGNIVKLRYLVKLEKLDAVPPKPQKEPSGFVKIGNYLQNNFNNNNKIGMEKSK